MPRLPYLLLSVALAVPACAGGSDRVVEMQGRRFVPDSIVVDAGEALRFVNASAEPHTVTAYEASLPEGAGYFASGGAVSEEEARAQIGAGLVTEGEAFEVTFDVPGTYEYFCIPHEDQGMTGRVIVRE